MRVICVGGARPNFVKVAPLLRAMAASDRIQPCFVHTGQHYDDAMSRVFLTQLGLPPPAVELAVGSGSHAEQSAAVLVRFERVLRDVQPHVVVVVGDVNSTMACALATAKFSLDRPFGCALAPPLRRRPLIAHVEAGLRSGDADMPEEINRRVTDAVADLLFTTEAAANANLAREGVAAERIHFVGNVMIDSLLALPRDPPGPTAGHGAAGLGLAPGSYALLTLHRPSNVDDPRRLGELLDCVAAATGERTVVFPVHPRTRAQLPAAYQPTADKWRLIDPCGYVEFVGLMAGAAVVCTDSGGVQEETTVLGTPCVTLRLTTERPVTISHGTNRLAGTEPAAIAAAIRGALAAAPHRGPPPPLWDGQAAPRIVRVLESLIPEG